MQCYCKSNDLKLLGTKKNELGWLGYPKKFDIFQCNNCKSILNKDYVFKKSFYETAYHDSFQNAKGVATYKKRWSHDVIVANKRILHLSSVLKMLCNIDATLKSKWKTLDIGCANGAFVALAQQGTHWDAYGIDIHRCKHKQNIFQGDFVEYDWKDNVYGLVTIFDVFEHVSNPFHAALVLSNISSDFIYFDQPDPCSKPALEKRLNWKHIKPLEHNCLISEKLLSEFMGFHGFKLLHKSSPVEGRMSLIYKLGENK